MAPKEGGRFASVKTDPRFRKAKASKAKVQLDDRFKAVLDEGGVFAADNKRDKAKTDKYGRTVASTHDRDQLRKFYSIGNEDGKKAAAAKAEDDQPAFVDYARGEGLLSSSDEDSSEDDAAAADDDDEEEDGNQFIEFGGSKRRRDRDGEVEVNLDEEDETDPSALALLEEQAAAYSDANPQEQTTETHSKRLAVVNLDWDHLHSIDLFKVFSSVLELGGGGRGKVERVQVFPSEFGKERMEREEREGPPREVFVSEREKAAASDDDEDDEEDDMEMEPEEGLSGAEDDDGEEPSEGASGSEQEEEDDDDSEDEDDEDINIEDLMADDKGEEIDMDKLRSYQLERLRYYYAVATFTTVAAASYVYAECDNTEFERTANIMDLRFVPDEMEFEDEPRDEATEVPALYKGLDFVTDALRHSSVKLTWDDDAPARVAVTRRKLSRKEIDDQDFSAFLASDSESDNEESRTRLRQLLLGNLDERDEAEAFGNDSDDDDEGGKAGGMEITFTPGLTEGGAAAGDGDDDDENITTLEAYKRKMREKRRVKKEEREKRLAEDGPSSGDEDGKPKKKDTKKTGKVAKDDFFAAADSSGDELDANVVQVKPKKGAKGKKAPTEAEAKEAAMLDLLTLPSSTTTAAEEALGIDQTKHFSMNDIIKEEKGAGKKRRRAPHGKKAGADREKEVELGDKNFEIDVTDERFSKKLIDDHRFAIDPSNPHFKKTKAMGKLLEERAKARDQRAGPQERTPASSSAKAPKTSSGGRDKELDSLVASAKRKAGGGGGGSGGQGEGKKRRRK